MTPEAILAAITAVATATAEACKLAQTEQGQALIAQSLKDRAAFERDVAAVRDWLGKLFTGKL